MKKGKGEGSAQRFRNPMIGNDEDEDGSTEIERFRSPKIGNGDDEVEVAANEDLLIQILLFLPPKSLLRFKSVSKAWLSLISSRRFRLLKSSRFFRKDISGMLLNSPWFRDRRYDFLPLDGDSFDLQGYPALESPDFVSAGDELVVLQSCNGLLLCERKARAKALALECNYYVINPTTREYSTFFVEGFRGVYDDLLCVALAFDPRKSINFKLICVWVSFPHDDEYDLRVYSSETGIMAQIGETVKVEPTFLPYIGTGVYWNDAINWIHRSYGCYFKVNEVRFGKIPMPPMLHTDEERWVRYTGEANDHLYLICSECAPTTQLNVYELDRGYSGWSLRFCIDLQPVFSLFPEAINPSLHPCYRYMFEIRCIIEKDDDEESIMLLTLPGKLIRFNLKDESFTKMCDCATVGGLGMCHRSLNDNGSFPIIESLHPL